MKLPLLGGAYGGRSSTVSPERLVNFYLESYGDGFHLVGTPGLTLRLTLDASPVRGLHFFNSNIYAAAGNRVYQISSFHAATTLGTLTTSTGPVFFEDNGTDVVVIDGSPNGYSISSGVMSLIADVDFEGGSSIAEQDGYFIVTVPSSSRFRISDLNSSTSWVDTDFTSVDGQGDKVSAVVSDLRQLWLPGEKTTEVYDNTGDSDFPFERIEAGFMQKGIAAPATLKRFDNSLVWLSKDERGHGLLVQANGYTPVIISPQPINWQWSRYSRIDDAFAYVYQIEGHEFYVITFPTGNATWAYDAREKQWHQWSSNISGNEQSRHRSNCHCFGFGRHYVGDFESGNVYSIEPDVYTENGTTIIRDRISINLDNDNERFSIDEIEIECQPGVGLSTGQGSNPLIMLRTSKDEGNTWGNERTRSAGAIGQYLRRAVWRKLGRSRKRAFWLRVSDPVKWVITSAIGRSRDIDEERRGIQ